MALWTLVLAAAALAAAAAVAKAVSFLLRCWAANRKFLASPIPGPPPSNFFGHVSYIMGPKGPFAFKAWHAAHGPLYKIQLLDSFAVVLSDPDTIARVTRRTTPGPYLPKPREIYESMEISTRPKVPNIVTANDGHYWRAVRQAAAPCFSMSNLKQVVPLVLELSQRAADHMSSLSCFDVTDAAKRVTSDVMGHLLYGEDLRGVTWEPSEYLSVLYPVLKAEAALFNNPLHLWQLWDPEIRQQRRCIAQHDALMTQKVHRLRKDPPAPHTIAAHILSAIDPDTGRPLTDAQAKAEVGVFMAAGFETTSHAITWCLTMLACYPEVQEQVYAELQEAGLAASGDRAGREFAASDLNRLPLLSAAIKEALRLCTPVPYGGTRHVVDDGGAELCGYKVPKGAIVMMPLLPFGLSQRIYGADVLEYKPERWMTATAAGDGKAAAAAAGGSVLTSPAAGGGAVPPDPLTFLTGQRDCIGQNLAKLEVQVVLATWLSRFRFSPGPELDRELQVAAATGQPVVAAVHALSGDFITLQPLSGSMDLRLEARA